jgi:hypothetical protein
MGGSLLEPQEELQRTDQEIGDSPGGKEKGRRGKLREEQRPGKEGRLRLRVLKCGGLRFFHARSREESASPLPRERRVTNQP